MKVKKREDGIDLVPESNFERDCLKDLKGRSIKKIYFEDKWESSGNLLVDFNTGWD